MFLSDINNMNILVLGENNYHHLLELLTDENSYTIEQNAYVTTMYLSSNPLDTSYQSVKFYLNWTQPPLTNIRGRYWSLNIKKFQPNVFFIILESNNEISYIQSYLQLFYTKILEGLDPDASKADNMAKVYKLVFLMLYRYRSTVLEGIGSITSLYNDFKRIFQSSTLLEKKIDLQNPNKQEFLNLIFSLNQIISTN